MGKAGHRWSQPRAGNGQAIIRTFGSLLLKLATVLSRSNISLLITNLNPTNQNNLNIVFAGANNVPTASIGGWAHADATSTANEKGDLFFRTKNAGAFKEHMRVNHQGKIIYSCNHD